jgi:hypothetical protein
MTRRFLKQLVFALLFAIAMLATGLCCAAEPTADFYVSPRGSDTWSGTLSEPNDPRTDGPFATLQRARDAVRESLKNRSGDIVVLIRGGNLPAEPDHCVWGTNRPVTSATRTLRVASFGRPGGESDKAFHSETF